MLICFLLVPSHLPPCGKGENSKTHSGVSWIFDGDSCNSKRGPAVKFCKPHSLDESYAKLVTYRAWFGVTRSILKWVMVSDINYLWA